VESPPIETEKIDGSLQAAWPKLRPDSKHATERCRRAASSTPKAWAKEFD
jgi:hypothetical protein